MYFGRMVFIILSTALFVVGCDNNLSSQPSQSVTGASKQQESTAPATVTFATNFNNTTMEEIQRYIIKPTESKYPNITVKVINTGEQSRKLADLVAAKEAPDIYFSGVGTVTGDLIPLGLAYDMSDLIKKHQFDVDRIQQVFFDAIRIGTGMKGTIGITAWNQGFGLIYNKDLFDKFAVPYPKDGMTWDQISELAIKLTRSDSGEQYYGLWPDNVYRGANQLGLPFADWDNHKGVFETEAWKNLFAYWYGLYKLPGYAPKGTNYLKEFNAGRVAMISGSTSDAQNLLAIPNINWDVVTYPQNPKAPGMGQRVTGYDLYLTSTSQNKDAAFQVISVVLSNEVQRDISHNGRMSSLKDQNIQNEFGKGRPQFQNKNVIAFTKPKLAEMPEYKDIPSYKMANDAFDSVLYDGKDINTALREANEKVNQAIQAELSK